ncbi:MAG TPA: right-handed parallel beta-helix repeat-containing protein, partial [Gemmatimonadales bacterium]|nr:right-handed parallel beta-helix repeat-containing protein [Gemmatimonadales bacterium]
VHSGGGGGGGTGIGGSTLTVVAAKDQQAGLTNGVVQIQVELTGATEIDNQTIDWTVIGGGGNVPATSQTTNTGVATVNWTLGSTIGLQYLKAEYTEPGSSTPLSVNISAVGVTNPACVPGRYLSGGLAQTETWTSAGGTIVLPNGANTPQNGLITVAAGTTVCLGPLQSILLDHGGRLSAGGAGAPATFTAMDLAQPWGSLRFDGAPAQPSTITNAVLDHGSLGAIGLSAGHVLQIENSTITEMAGLGVRIIASGSFVHTTNISNVGGPAGNAGARLGSPLAPLAVLDFSARVTNTGGISIEAAGAVLTACEIANSTGGIYVLSGAGPVSINGCNITGNGIGIMNQANASVDATGNWWGASGPSGVLNSGSVDTSSPLGGPVSLGY